MSNAFTISLTETLIKHKLNVLNFIACFILYLSYFFD